MQTKDTRRSRLRRQSTGKRLILTDRDVHIFRLLARYRYLRSSYIHAFVGGNRTKLIERLGDLYHEGGYLNRPGQQWDSPLARYQPAIYELDTTGKSALGQSGISVERATWIGFSGEGIQRQFAHALMICEVLASIELGVKSTPGLRFITFDEILTRSRPEGARTASGPLALGTAHNAIIPDAVFGLEYERDGRKTYRFFALEADRGTMPVTRSNCRQSSLRRKLSEYGEVIAAEQYQIRYGLPNLFVLVVVVGEGRLRSIEQTMRQGSDDSRFYLFKCGSFGPFGSPRAPDLRLLSNPWQRFGHPPLDLGRP